MSALPRRKTSAHAPPCAVLALAFALLTMPGPARAQDVTQEQAAREIEARELEARQSFAEELAVCAAFYLVTAEAYRRFEESANARAHTNLANLMIERAVTYGEEHNVMARARRAMKDLFALLGDNVRANMPAIAGLYGATCAEAYDYPDRRLQVWREKVAARQ